MVTKVGGTSELISLFRRFDVDRDGYITRGELAAFLAHKKGVSVHMISGAQLDRIMTKADKSKDGKINYEEFGSWIIAENAPDDVRELFRRFDVNGDGVIARAEIRSFLARKNRLSENRVPEHKIDEILAKADKSGDGFIDYEEFVSWILGENTSNRGPGRKHFNDAPRDNESLRSAGQVPRQIVPREGASARDILDAFERFDVNKDGKVNRDELRALLVMKLKVAVTDEQLDMVLDKADKNSDGILNYQEFVKWILDDSAGNGGLPQQKLSSPSSAQSSGGAMGGGVSPLGNAGRAVLDGGKTSPRKSSKGTYPVIGPSGVYLREESIYKATSDGNSIALATLDVHQDFSAGRGQRPDKAT